MTKRILFWAQRVAAALLVLTGSVVAVAVIFVIVSGTQAPQSPLRGAGEPPPPCSSGGGTTPSQVLVLANNPADATTSVHVGDVIELSFPAWQGGTLPTPVQQSPLTCSLGPVPGSPNSTLLVRALQTGTVRFYTRTCPYGHCSSTQFYGRVTIQ